MDLNDFKDVGCGCGNMEYLQTFIFKVVPAIMSQNGQEQIAPIPSRFVCTQCGKDVYETVQESKLDESKLIL